MARNRCTTSRMTAKSRDTEAASMCYQVQWLDELVTCRLGTTSLTDTCIARGMMLVRGRRGRPATVWHRKLRQKGKKSLISDYKTSEA